MVIREFIGKRVLATLATTYGSRNSIEEYRLIELSPSGNYVRIMNAHGTKFWRLTTDVAVVETLVLPEPYPREERGL